MRFKKNIPVLGVVFLVVGIVAALIILSPTPEERFASDVREYARTLGTAVNIELLGEGIAEIELAPGKRYVWAEFTQLAGKWTFSKDLAVDFEETLKEKDREREVLERLATRISKRFPNFNVSLKQGLRCFHLVSRESRGIIGRFRINFSYPEVQGQQLQGWYEESFLYKEGEWVSEGMGRLFEQPWQRPR